MGEIVDVVAAAVSFGNDVLDMEHRKRRIILMTKTIWSAPAERSGDGALDFWSQIQSGVALRPPQRDCRAGDPGACHRTPKSTLANVRSDLCADHL